MSLIAYVTRIHFADRVVDDALPEELRRLSLSRVLILTDGAGERDDGFDRVVDGLPAGVGFAALRHCPPPAASRSVAEVADAVAQQACDGVLALGGAGALSLARAAGQRAACPVVALPTTTADVGLGAMPPALGAAPVPALVLCDATLTLGAGPSETAAEGMDALIHCLEAYLGTTWNPPADGMALDGLRRAAAHLERAVSHPEDLSARREMLAAALNAGLAAQKGLGGVHALAHALEFETGAGARHGTLHAALLPAVMAFNAPAIGERVEGLATALGLPRGVDMGEALAALGHRVGLPRGLSALGLDAGALGRVARAATEDAAHRTNPRHATSEDYRAMLQAAG